MRITFLKFLDKYFGRLLADVFPSQRASCIRGNIDTFLLIRPGGIGDAVLLIPVIQALKEKYPDAKVDILAEQRNAPIFKLCPHVDTVMKYDKGDLFTALYSKYDVVIDTEQWHRLSAVVARLIGSRVKIGYGTNERRKLFSHAVDYSHERYEFNSFCDLLEPLSVAVPEVMPETFLTIPADGRQRTEQFLSSLNQRPYVVLFPGASIPERRWGQEKFHQLAACLNQAGYPAVVVGGREDASAGETIVSGLDGINLAGETSLIGSAAVIDNAALLVSGDSGMLHVGVGLGVPTVSLFGSGIAEKWAPKGEKHIVINKHLDCSPCTRFGTTPPCPIDTKCLTDIVVDEVASAALSLLEIPRRGSSR